MQDDNEMLPGLKTGFRSRRAALAWASKHAVTNPIIKIFWGEYEVHYHASREFIRQLKFDNMLDSAY